MGLTLRKQNMRDAADAQNGNKAAFARAFLDVYALKYGKQKNDRPRRTTWGSGFSLAANTAALADAKKPARKRVVLKCAGA
jgi:hypothetical protein